MMSDPSFLPNVQEQTEKTDVHKSSKLPDPSSLERRKKHDGGDDAQSSPTLSFSSLLQQMNETIWQDGVRKTSGKPEPTSHQLRQNPVQTTPLLPQSLQKQMQARGEQDAVHTSRMLPSHLHQQGQVRQDVGLATLHEKNCNRMPTQDMKANWIRQSPGYSTVPLPCSPNTPQMQHSSSTHLWLQHHFGRQWQHRQYPHQLQQWQHQHSQEMARQYHAWHYQHQQQLDARRMQQEKHWPREKRQQQLQQHYQNYSQQQQQKQQQQQGQEQQQQHQQQQRHENQDAWQHRNFILECQSFIRLHGYHPQYHHSQTQSLPGYNHAHATKENSQMHTQQPQHHTFAQSPQETSQIQAQLSHQHSPEKPSQKDSELHTQRSEKHNSTQSPQTNSQLQAQSPQQQSPEQQPQELLQVQQPQQHSPVQPPQELGQAQTQPPQQSSEHRQAQEQQPQQYNYGHSAENHKQNQLHRPHHHIPPQSYEQHPHTQVMQQRCQRWPRQMPTVPSHTAQEYPPPSYQSHHHRISTGYMDEPSQPRAHAPDHVYNTCRRQMTQQLAGQHNHQLNDIQEKETSDNINKNQASLEAQSLRILQNSPKPVLQENYNKNPVDVQENNDCSARKTQSPCEKIEDQMSPLFLESTQYIRNAYADTIEREFKVVSDFMRIDFPANSDLFITSENNTNSRKEDDTISATYTSNVTAHNELLGSESEDAATVKTDKRSESIGSTVEIWCYTCDKKVPKEELYDHLFFGSIECVLCQGFLIDCERFKQRMVNGHGICVRSPIGASHYYAIWRNPISQIVYNITDDLMNYGFYGNVRGLATNANINLAVTEYINKFTDLEEQSPWHLAIRYIKKQTIVLKQRYSKQIADANLESSRKIKSDEWEVKESSENKGQMSVNTNKQSTAEELSSFHTVSLAGSRVAGGSTNEIAMKTIAPVTITLDESDELEEAMDPDGYIYDNADLMDIESVFEYTVVMDKHNNQ